MSFKFIQNQQQKLDKYLYIHTITSNPHINIFTHFLDNFHYKYRNTTHSINSILFATNISSL